MITTTLFPGRYVQGAHTMDRLGKELSSLGDKALVLVDPFVLENVLPDIADKIESELNCEIESFSGECSDEEIERLSKLADDKQCDCVAGVGGGKTLDTAKAVAHACNQPVGIAPTLASTDAPCSALAVIYTQEGAFKRYLFLPKNPELVLVDTQVVAQAPARFLVCGIGDALATWFEAESCKRNRAPNMRGDHGSLTAYALAQLCYDTLLEYGLYAKSACEAGVVTPALEHIVEANTLLSGLGFESGGLAACHSIHNGLTVLEDTHDLYHGEKVAFGVLASLFLADRSQETIDTVYRFCENIGLPTTFERIGLKKPDREDLLKVGEAACAEGETIHNEPMPVSADVVASCLQAADAEGRRRMGDL